MKNNSNSGTIYTDRRRKTYHRVLDSSGNEKYRYLQTDAIQKLKTPDDIVKFFQYTDKYDDLHSPIKESFSALKLDVQKEAAEGLQWARETYLLDSLPLEITAGTFRKTTTLGEYNETRRILKFKRSLKEDTAFETAVHEMTHYTVHVHGISVDDILLQAASNLQLKRNTRAYKDMLFYIANEYDYDAHEVVACSMEMYATNRSNLLSKEIARLFIERAIR